MKTNGGYIVLPPSYWWEVDGHYRWIVPPRGNLLPSLPRWAVEMLKPKPEPKRSPKPIDLHNLRGYQRQAAADLNEALRRVAALTDGRHEAPFKMASWLGPYVHNGMLAESTLRDGLYSASQANGFLKKHNRSDFEGQVTRGLAKAANKALPPLAREHRIAQAT